MNLSFETLFLAKTSEFMPICHSTNDILLDQAKNNLAKEGHIIITNNQTNGRGQRGNIWQSTPGKNLTFSIYLTPNLDATKNQLLSMVTSLAILNTIKEFTPKTVKIKWPNDIYVSNKGRWHKISGILTENIIQSQKIIGSIIGIGLNINQEQFQIETACSLYSLEKTNFELYDVLGKLLMHFEKLYFGNGKFEANLKYNYTQNLLFYGETAKFEDALGYFEGVILGVEDTGMISIQRDNRVAKYDIKEIKFIL